MDFVGSGIFPFLASVLQAMIEFCLGVYLLFGIRRRTTPLFMLLIMGVMTPLTLWLAIDNPISDCGCFGDAVVLTNWQTFWKNCFLLLAAVSVFKWRNCITPLITKRFDWLVALYTFLYILGMTLYCYRELPVSISDLTISALIFVKEWKFRKVLSPLFMKLALS